MTIRFEYGEYVRDKITDYTGRVTAVCYSFGHSNTRYLVESIDGAERPIEWWVDEDRLVHEEVPINV